MREEPKSQLDIILNIKTHQRVQIRVGSVVGLILADLKQKGKVER